MRPARGWINLLFKINTDMDSCFDTFPAKSVQTKQQRKRRDKTDERRLNRRRTKTKGTDETTETLFSLLLGIDLDVVLAWMRMTCTPPLDEATLSDWWISARQQKSKAMDKGLASFALLMPWMTWKHRNAGTFNQARPSTEY
jgi:hypothetical protein